MQTVLINFNVPLSTKRRLDEICHASGRTRTAVLVDMINSFIIDQGRVLAETAKVLEELDHTIEKKRRLMGFKELLANQTAEDDSILHSRSGSNLDLPDPMFSDGLDEW